MLSRHTTKAMLKSCMPMRVYFATSTAGAAPGVEVVEEVVLPRIERADHHHGLGVRRQHLLLVKLDALELGRGVVLVADVEAEPGFRRNLQPLRVDDAVLEHDLEGRSVVVGRRPGAAAQGEKTGQRRGRLRARHQ